MLRVWREAIPSSAGPIDSETDLFDIGGTSLTAATIASQARKLTGRLVRVRDVMEFPTPRQLSEAAAVAPLVTQGPLNSLSSRMGQASVQQQTIWFLEQLLPRNTAYNSVVMARIHGPLDIQRLRAACASSLHRHELLRSRFETIDGTLTRISGPVPPPIFDHRRISEPADQVAEVLAAEPFDTSETPLIRWHLLESAPDEYALVQVEHHLVHDGWSTWIVLSDISDHYRQLSTTTYDDRGAYDSFSRDQLEWLESADGQAKRDFWRLLLEPVVHSSESARTLIPPDWAEPRPELFTAYGATIESWLPDHLVTSVRVMAAEIRTTPFVVLWTAFAILVGHHRGEGDASFAIGSMLRNRPNAGDERSVGMYVNTIALPVRNWDRSSFSDLVARTHSSFLLAEENGAVPFPIVVSDLNLKRDLSRNPVFQECFSMIDWPKNNFELGSGLDTSMDYPTNGGAKFDLDVVIMPERGTFRILWRYYTGVLDAETVRSLILEFNEVLESAAKEIHAPISDLRSSLGTSS